MPHESTPVIIGAGQFTHRGGAASAPAPLELIRIAALAATKDAGLAESALSGLDAIGVVGFAFDSEGALARLPVPRRTNTPASLARALGAAPRWSAQTHMGGNASQHLINTMAERIAAGESDFGLAVGGEFMGSLMKRLSGNLGFEGYGDGPGDGDDGPPMLIGDGRSGVTPQEDAHGLGLPVNTYPLFENALRARDGRSLSAHRARMVSSCSAIS